MTVHCSVRLPAPEVAGCCDIVDRESGKVVKEAVQVLREWAELWPHLRPCPKQKGSRGTWNWIERTVCETCSRAVRNKE